MSDAVWLAIIGVIAMIVKEYFDRLRAHDAEARLRKSDAIKNEKLDNLTTEVSVVKDQTNGLQETLVKQATDSGFVAGVKSETDKGK